MLVVVEKDAAQDNEGSGDDDNVSADSAEGDCANTHLAGARAAVDYNGAAASNTAPASTFRPSPASAFA